MTQDPQQLERKSSFFLPFLLLGNKQREALTLLYRFCRVADDVSDESGTSLQKRRRFKTLQSELESCLAGHPNGLFWVSFKQSIDTHHIPPQALRDTMRGVAMDLKTIRFQTFTELLSYAHLVAGGPGRAAMAIFGGHGPRHERYAENLGAFLQITNVVRDYLEDRELGRLYLPLKDMKRFGIDPRHPAPGPKWDAFVRFELELAWSYWESAQRSLETCERSRLIAAEGMASVYARLHYRLKKNPSAILQCRVNLSAWDKVAATLTAAFRCGLWRLKPKNSNCGCGS
jgi:phytoene synthase